MRHLRSISFALKTKTTLTCEDSKTVDAYAASCKVRRPFDLFTFGTELGASSGSLYQLARFTAISYHSFWAAFFSSSFLSLLTHCQSTTAAPPPPSSLSSPNKGWFPPRDLRNTHTFIRGVGWWRGSSSGISRSRSSFLSLTFFSVVIF